MDDMLRFYKNKRVFITGHTGFKGSWLCSVLLKYGAVVCGYSLSPEADNNLFDICKLSNKVQHNIGDIRDFENLFKVFSEFEPEIVIHLAAQPLVRESYDNPKYTYDVNVMGTVNILECVRKTNSVKSVLNVTTDKVYENKEWEYGYRENDILNGYDPYSNSKSCSELVTSSYKKSFFGDREISVSSARAGNVIGGGDFAKDRIIPDCVRSSMKNKTIIVRNPYSVRPYQHVLEPIVAYLLIIQKQYEDKKYATEYNVGPDDSNCITTGLLVDKFCESWGGQMWENVCTDSVHEANLLKLDCSKIKVKLGWKPLWDINDTIRETVVWYKNYSTGEDVIKIMDKQIEEYMTLNRS